MGKRNEPPPAPSIDFYGKATEGVAYRALHSMENTGVTDLRRYGSSRCVAVEIRRARWRLELALFHSHRRENTVYAQYSPVRNIITDSSQINDANAHISQSKAKRSVC